MKLENAINKDEAENEIDKDRLEKAINYRLVLEIAGVSVVNEWGDKKNSLGYNEAKRLFEKEYSLITFEEFKDEIILAWIGEAANKKMLKKSMAQVLDSETSNEDYRPLFKKMSDKVKEQDKEISLIDIPEYIKENKESIEDAINSIDELHYDIVKKSRGVVEARLKTQEEAKKEEAKKEEAEKKENAKSDEKNEKFKENKVNSQEIKVDNKNFEIEFDEQNLNKAVSSIEYIRDNFAVIWDTDDCLNTLKEYNTKINNSEIPPSNYTESMELEIKANVDARLNTISPNNKSRVRTKETIFDKIDYSKLMNMKLKDFISGYNELIELYDEFNKNIENVDDLVKFYNIESKFNLIFYINIAINLYEDTSSEKIELAKQLSRLALMDSYIYRSNKMKSKISTLIYEFNEETQVYNKSYHEIYNKIIKLIDLKNRIVSNLLEVTGLDFEKYKDQAFNIISLEAKNEITNQVNKVDIINYLKLGYDKNAEKKIFKNLKYLMANNKKILLERSRIKKYIIHKKNMEALAFS